MISIIIPTKNEENYLPRLLKSIKQQKLKEYELIVADGDSTDNTIKIAKQFGARITQGASHGAGRNAGAKIAKGDILFFHDADIILPKGFLNDNLKEFNNKELDIATTLLIPISDHLVDRIIFKGWNLAYLALSKIRPISDGFSIIVRKDAFEKAKGFDETIHYGEDSDFVNRVVKKGGGKFGILKATPTEVSVRRLDKEGRIKFLIKIFYAVLYQAFFGKIRSDIMHYRFGEHE